MLIPKDSSPSAAFAACASPAQGQYQFNFSIAFNVKILTGCDRSTDRFAFAPKRVRSGHTSLRVPFPAFSASNIVRRLTPQIKNFKTMIRNINNLRQRSSKRSAFPLRPLPTTANKSVSTSAERLGLINYRHPPRNGQTS